MARGRHTVQVVLVGEESVRLVELSQGVEGPAIAVRAQIVLECAKGLTNSAAALNLGVSRHVAAKWRGRFVARRLDGLRDAPRSGRPISAHHSIPVELTEGERKELERLSQRRKTSQDLALRARIVLGCASGASNREVAEQEKVGPRTVGKWRKRFLQGRLEGLLDEPRPGTPRKISDEKVEEVIRLTLETTPEDATHWSTRSMAKQAGMTQTVISRIWRAFGLRPHRTEFFKLSTDPFLIDKVRDIVGLYLDPPEKAAVLCVDEKSQIQALDRKHPMLPLRPGQVERKSYDYKRNGTTSLFAALNAATGEVLGRCYRRHRTVEFRRFLDLVDKNVPRELDVHLVLDNYGTHKTALIHGWLLKRPRFHLHFTPTSGSWLNLVERWFGLLTEKRIRRGTFDNVLQLEQAILEWIKVYAKNPRPFVWTKTADQILENIKRFCERTSNSGH